MLRTFPSLQQACYEYSEYQGRAKTGIYKKMTTDLVGGSPSLATPSITSSVSQDSSVLPGPWSLNIVVAYLHRWV